MPAFVPSRSAVFDACDTLICSLSTVGESRP